MKNLRWIALVIITLIIAVVGIKMKFSPIDTWIAIKQGPIVEAVYGLGTVTSDRELKLKPGVASTVKRIYVKEGDQVKQGDPLIQLSELPLNRAPFAGTITDIPFKEGENIFPQIPILTLMDLKNLYLSMVIEQTSAILIRNGQKVSLAFESFRGHRFEGVVRSITPKEGQFFVRIQVDNLPEGILPGMTADCAVAVAKKENASLIPLKAIRNGKIQFRTIATTETKTANVKLGVIDGEWAELLEPKIESAQQTEVLVTASKKP